MLFLQRLLGVGHQRALNPNSAGQHTEFGPDKANWVTRKLKLSSKVSCLLIVFFESVAAFSLLLQIQDILFYFVSFFVGVARQLKRHSSASLEPLCMPNVHGLLRFCCHKTQQDKCPLHKKLGTLLDLCVSSLRRGHANLLCIVPVLSDDPRRESGKLYIRDVHVVQQHRDETLKSEPKTTKVSDC